MRAQNAAARPFDVSRFEDEVRDVVQQTGSHIRAIDHWPRTPAPPVPEYVSHREGATEIGKLSAEAIVQEYEAAAKEIEAMGEVMKKRLRSDGQAHRRGRVRPLGRRRDASGAIVPKPVPALAAVIE